MPIDEGMFLSCVTAGQKVVPNRELQRAARCRRSVAGHLDLFGFRDGYVEQIDGHLSELPKDPA
jgi:hypothetical protein